MKHLLTVLLLALFLAPAAMGAGTVVLGVLEHPQCKEDSGPAVRALFTKRADGWTALSTQEAAQGVSVAEVRWTVVLDGRRIGSIKTIDRGFETSYAWTYARDRLLSIAPGQPVPAIKNEGNSFGGWCDPPANRPLVVLSAPNSGDPQRWKPFRPGASLRADLFPHFHEAAGPAMNCSPANSDSAVAWAYSAGALVFRGGYRDNTGRKLVGLALNPQLNHCDGPLGGVWSTHWFLVGKTVRSLANLTLASAEYDYEGNLSLVDAGDYDGDGESEILFWYSGYNEDGYTLFYDGLRKRSDYYWNYH